MAHPVRSARPEDSKLKELDLEMLDEVTGGLHVPGGIYPKNALTFVPTPNLVYGHPSSPLDPYHPASPYGAAPQGLVAFGAGIAQQIDGQHGTVANAAVRTATGTTTTTALASQLANSTHGAIVYGGDLDHNGRISTRDFLHNAQVSEVAAAQAVGNIIDQISHLTPANAPNVPMATPRPNLSPASFIQQLLGSTLGQPSIASRAAQAPRPAPSRPTTYAPPRASNTTGTSTSSHASELAAVERGQEIARNQPLSPNDNWDGDAVQRVIDANTSRSADAQARGEEIARNHPQVTSDVWDADAVDRMLGNSSTTSANTGNPSYVNTFDEFAGVDAAVTAQAQEQALAADPLATP
jgi:hypothetical protein